MLVHCTKKLAAKLPSVSDVALANDSPTGSWHAHLYHIDRRQCVMFCHDLSRYALFVPGVTKSHFAELGEVHRELFLATLVAFGMSEAGIKAAVFSLGPVAYDSLTDRSVLASMRVVRDDLEGMLQTVPNVMDLDPIAVSCHLSHRPATVNKRWIWPDKIMLETIEMLTVKR